MPDGFWITLVKSLVLANLVMGVFAMLTWAERRILGRFQNRLGPNRVGPYGMLQPIADLVKLIRKESLLPEGINPALYLMAPVVSLFASLAVFAVIPFGGLVTVPGTDFQFHLWISDPSVGLLVVFALGSLSFYGFLVGGWSSASKYSLYGSMRAGSQLVSYEVSLALAVIGVVMMAQTLSLPGIVEAQKHDGIPYIVPQFLGFVIYVIASTAEVSRIPFDLPEAEGELVAGYHTEYGGMRWAMFQNAEYVALIAFAAIASVLFLGGPVGPAWLPLPGPIWMAIKMGVFILLQMWVRGTLPRVRYDHLMSLGWKLLLPAATINLLITSVVVAYRA